MLKALIPSDSAAALGSGRVPFMANVQGADVIDLPEYDYGYRRYPVPRQAVKYALRKAALIRVISSLLGDYVEKEGLVGKERIVTILRAIEDTAFPPSGQSLDGLRDGGREMLSEKYGIRRSSPARHYDAEQVAPVQGIGIPCRRDEDRCCGAPQTGH